MKTSISWGSQGSALQKIPQLENSPIGLSTIGYLKKPIGYLKYLIGDIITDWVYSSVSPLKSSASDNIQIQIVLVM